MERLKILLFLFPLLFLIHDVEEILNIEEFLDKHKEIPFSVSMWQFSLAFLLLWILSLMGCIQVLRGKTFLGMSFSTYFLFLIPGVFLANGIGHLLQSLIFKGYVPGLYTTIIVILPYTVYSLYYLFTQKFVTVKRVLLFFVIGFIVQGPAALLALLVGKLFV